MEFPERLKYTREHEWIWIDGDIATIGITSFAQSELGDIVFVEIPNIGQTLKKDEVFGTIEAVKTVSDLFLPVDGTVLEINPAIKNTPELVNTDPYDKGWLIRMKIEDKSQLEGLMSAEAYGALIG